MPRLHRPGIDTWRASMHDRAHRLADLHPQHRRAAGDIHELVDQVADDAPAAAAYTATGDGLRSAGTAPGVSGGGHGDPVGDLVAAAVDRATTTTDRSAHHRGDAHHTLGQALLTVDPDRRRTLVATVIDHLEKALPLLHRQLPNRAALVAMVTSDQGDPGCGSCKRAGRYSPTFRAGRCSFCYRWRLAEGVDPPRHVLDTHLAGKRITTKTVTEARMAARTKTKTRTKKRKGRRST